MARSDPLDSLPPQSREREFAGGARRLLEEGRGVVAGPVAFFLGLVGQALLSYGQLVLAGALLLGAATLLAAFAWGPHPMPALPTVIVKPTARNWLPSWRIASISGALVLAAGGVLLQIAHPGEIFGPQGILWVASMALFAAACVGWRVGAKATDEPPWGRQEGALFVGLNLLALCTFIFRLGDIPWRFHYDEALAYVEAMRFYRGPEISLFTTTWSGTSLPSFWFAISAGLMRLAGTNLEGVRLGVALAGALTTVPLYGLGRLLAGRWAAGLAAFAWATSPVSIHYSRVSIINITTALAWTVCFYFLLKAWRHGKAVDFAWAGLAAGLSMYTYFGTRLLPYILLTFFAYLALYHRRKLRAQVTGVGLVVVGLLVGFGPLLGYFLAHPEMWAARGLSELSISAFNPSVPEDWASAWNVLAPLAVHNLLGFSIESSHDGVYWAPFLVPVQAVLVCLGFGILARRWRSPEAFLVLLWAVSVLFVGGTLVGKQFVPAFNHWTPAFPAFFLMLALAPTLWLRSLGEVPMRGWLGKVAAGGVALGFVALAVVGIRFYLVDYPGGVPPSYETAQGRLLASLGQDNRVLFVGNSWQPYYPAIGEMMGAQAKASDFLNPSRELPLASAGQQDLVFVFNSDELIYLPVVQSYYPDGRLSRIQSPVQDAQLYTVSAEDARSRYGVFLSLLSGGTTLWEGKVDGVGDLPPDWISSVMVKARWSGMFYMPAEGDAQIRGGSASGLIQGTRATQGEWVRVEKGWNPFSIEAAMPGAALPDLRVRVDGHESQPGATQLWPWTPGQGLAATLESRDGRVAHHIDPFIGAGVLDGAAHGAYDQPSSERDPYLVALGFESGGTARAAWEGELYTDAGTYTMELRTDAHARLAVDGQVVLNLCANVPRPEGVHIKGGVPPAKAEITVAAGWHHLRIDMEATGDANGLEWSWVRPDGVSEIVPPDRLRYLNSGDAEGQVVWPATGAGSGCKYK